MYENGDYARITEPLVKRSRGEYFRPNPRKSVGATRGRTNNAGPDVTIVRPIALLTDGGFFTITRG